MSRFSKALAGPFAAALSLFFAAQAMAVSWGPPVNVAASTTTVSYGAEALATRDAVARLTPARSATSLREAVLAVDMIVSPSWNDSHDHRGVMVSHSRDEGHP